ncbi:hypothetical protein GCM10028774_22120 [Spirosoma jeollabukense]
MLSGGCIPVEVFIRWKPNEATCHPCHRVVPDFLSTKELDAGPIKLVWEGFAPIENTLYSGTCNRTIYSKEINQIEAIFLKEMEPEVQIFD